MLGFFVRGFCLRQIPFFATDGTDFTDEIQEANVDLSCDIFIFCRGFRGFSRMKYKNFLLENL